MSNEAESGAWELAQVKEALGLLASSPQAQIHYLDALGVAPSLDELGLEFDDAWRLVPSLVCRGTLSTTVESIVAEIDASLRAMSRDHDLWVQEMLGAPAWKSVRTLSARALRSIQGTEPGD